MKKGPFRGPFIDPKTGKEVRQVSFIQNPTLRV